MKLSDHDLQPLNAEWLEARTREELLHLSEKRLDDLKEARERLNQNASNSSVPPGSQAAWCHPVGATEKDDDDDDTPMPPWPDDKEDGGEPGAEKAASCTEKEPKAVKGGKVQRKPGKPPGAQGFGQTQRLPVTATEHHRASQCAGCGQAFTSETPSCA